jgi:hypothetical protein
MCYVGDRVPSLGGVREQRLSAYGAQVSLRVRAAPSVPGAFCLYNAKDTLHCVYMLAAGVRGAALKEKLQRLGKGGNQQLTNLQH